jgi:phosphoribosyl-ATP pyrophosphohydrolase
VVYLSYTLRDAQHVCWKTYKKLGGNQTALSLASDLFEEASKVAVTVKEQPDKKEAKQALATELSDLLYDVFVLAEQRGINLEEIFLQSVNDRVLSNLP